MRPQISALVLVCSSLLAFAPEAAADPPLSTAEGPLARTKSAALYEESLGYYEKHKYEQARLSLVAAWALHRHWQIAALLGACELKLGKHRDAAEHFAIALRTVGPDAAPDAVKNLHAMNAEVTT